MKSGKSLADLEKDELYKDLPVNASMLQLCKDIEAYKKDNPKKAVKDVVKHFNKKSGLKEKPKKVAISFGTVAFASVYDDWNRLTTAEKILVATDPVNAYFTTVARDNAYSLTQQHMGKNGLGDKSDAFRHAIWNALICRYTMDETWAYLITTAHEDKSQEELNQKDADGYYKWQHKNMDLHNNQKGRDCWHWYDHPTWTWDSHLVDRVKAKMNAGELTWLHN